MHYSNRTENRGVCCRRGQNNGEKLLARQNLETGKILDFHYFCYYYYCYYYSFNFCTVFTLFRRLAGGR